ncbi:MAG: Uma2 family endonuclease [Chroococcidiopsidaceae cyanobacterium CP_BM_ER_R8_30]|nr:Uma2 family endonuclease [Chroococcidiopsidaceae cyanobacterium CP_BM_ER_R8_30]
MLSPGQSVLLSGMTWSQFEEILAELGEHRANRIAYDQGMLEIMVPLPEHEYFKSSIGDLIQDLAEELGIEYECFGSTTWKKQEKMAGAEPDECFYIQSLPAILGRLDIDLNQDPPPDLVLEVDMTNKSLNRLQIYSRLGVPEVWRYDQGQLWLYHLVEEYVETESSLTFPEFPVKRIPDFVKQNLMTGRTALRRRFREWVRSL